MGQLGTHLGHEVRSLRQERGWSQAQLAEAAGTSEEWIRRIELGARAPSLDTLEALSKALAVSVARLFAGYGDDPIADAERLLFDTKGFTEEQMRWLETAAKLLRNMPRTRGT